MTAPNPILEKAKEYLSLANHLADIGREIALQFFRKPSRVQNKADATPVTEADTRIERKMREILTQQVPDHGIFGEEEEGVRLESDWVWVIDPIDGTKAFAAGLPMFGCLISLTYQGQALLGIIEAPFFHERFVGVLGEGTLWNGKEVLPNPPDALEDSILGCTSPEMFIAPGTLERFESLAEQCRFRRFGADCYGYGMMAAGFLHIIVEGRLEPYDYMALVPVVEGAGGRITDWKGKSLRLGSSPENGLVVAGGSQALHRQALAVLQG